MVKNSIVVQGSIKYLKIVQKRGNIKMCVNVQK